MASGAPDWQRVVVEASGSLTSGAPDWQRVIIGPGGSSVGGYASLTGPGETATPGELDQAGGFSVITAAIEALFDAMIVPGEIQLKTFGGAIAIAAQDGGNLFLDVIGGGTLYIGQVAHGPVIIRPPSLTIQNLPVTNPGGTGIVWDNGGVLNIT